MVRRTYDNGWQENKVCFSTPPILLDTELFESWSISFILSCATLEIYSNSSPSILHLGRHFGLNWFRLVFSMRKHMLLLQVLQIRMPIMSQLRKNMQPSIMKVQALFSDSVSSAQRTDTRIVALTRFKGRLMPILTNIRAWYNFCQSMHPAHLRLMHLQRSRPPRLSLCKSVNSVNLVMQPRTQFQTGVVFDASPIGQQFGSVVTDVSSTPYHAGDEVHVQFIGANPRVSSWGYNLFAITYQDQNNLRLESTFLAVEHLVSGNQWSTVKTDSHPSTTYRWTRTNTVCHPDLDWFSPLNYIRFWEQVSWI